MALVKKKIVSRSPHREAPKTSYFKHERNEGLGQSYKRFCKI